MNRIENIFVELRERGGKALMPFVTAGDPDLETTEALLPALGKAGASVVELGIPFSDPIADGPVIQASMTRALDRGLKIDDVLTMVQRVRPAVKLGIIAMVSYSIVYRFGVENFIRKTAAAGVDGFIFPDLPVEASDDVQKLAKDAGQTVSLLIAPTTTMQRARQIAQACSGFVYVVSRSGITGEQTKLPETLTERLRALREVTDLPLAVGFGISQAEQVRQVVSEADAAIVGSAMMRRIAECDEVSRDELVERVGAFTAELAGGLDVATAPS